MIKELGIKFNKDYNFLQIIKIVKFICGRGFDFLSSQVFVHNPETLQMHSSLLGTIYCNREAVL